MLDRNGLRPSRYYVTKDDMVIMGSEVGVLDVPADMVLRKGRLQPGRMFLIDTVEGRIVDDEEISRYVLRQHLAVPNLEVVEATSGDEVIREVTRLRPDVICLDLMMPEVDGVEVLHRLKSSRETRDIPVVVVTSKALAPAERSDLSDLACAVVSKESISREGVLAVIEDVLKLGESAA